MSGRTAIYLILILLSGIQGYSQGVCPDNIGFERGSFSKWKCYGGMKTGGGIVLQDSLSPIPLRHTIIQSNPGAPNLDPYGKFPVNCPNGSKYSIKLGNDSAGAMAERVSYSFTVPIDKNEYSIIYNYAIVFQNPGHAPEEQPKFTSRVYDETAGQYLGCGSFEFVSASALPGFQLSDQGDDVFYKPWSPVTVKLYNCAGKKITLEFEVNDCSLGGHFGYGYLDVNENCSSPISGNVYCNGATSIMLTAPFGFKEYRWYTHDFANLLATTHTLSFSPIPPVGTKYALEIIPYDGLGCKDTLYTTIQLSSEAFDFKLKDTLLTCSGTAADITNADLTFGSTRGLIYTYHLDSTALEYLPTPSYVLDEGTYFVKAVNMVGCTETKPISVRFKDLPFLVTDPPDGCEPSTVDITAPFITSGSASEFSYTYWLNDSATVPLPNPTAIDTTGRYYIKATSPICAKVQGVNVRLWGEGNLVTQPVITCDKADLTAYAVTAGSTPIFTFTPWKDAAATTPLDDPKNVSQGGTYYIKATTATGCYFVKPVQVTINPLPDFSIKAPPAVTAPYTASIAEAASSPDKLLTYSFWMDSTAIVPLERPAAINKSGRFFILATDTFGCRTIQAVNVVVNIPYHPVIQYPNAFSPNNDGINDGFRINVYGNINLHMFRIYDRWGALVFQSRNIFEYWQGKRNGKDLPVGTYYWIMELVNNNNLDFYRKTGTVTLIR